MKAAVLPLFLILLFSCKPENHVEQEIPVSKKVTYQIFAAKNYTGTLVENMNTEVRLQLRLINIRTGEQALVWDSLLPVRRLASFPLNDQKIVVEKDWPVLNSQQKLNGSCSVVYREGNTISQQAKSDEAVPGVHAITLEVSL